jgi:hypothetical protein
MRTMKKKNLDFAGFLKLMIDALQASGVEYLIGGAIAEWAWGEPRAIQDLDLVVKISIKSINKLSKELEKRDMLVPAEIGCCCGRPEGYTDQCFSYIVGSRLIFT